MEPNKINEIRKALLQYLNLAEVAGSEAVYRYREIHHMARQEQEELEELYGLFSKSLDLLNEHEKEFEELKSQAAAMREALQERCDRCEPGIVNYSTGEPECSMCLIHEIWQREGMETTAGRELLERLAKAEAVAKAIEDITPGGSEFAGDPDKCIGWIKDRLANTAELAQRAKKAEAELIRIGGYCTEEMNHAAEQLHEAQEKLRMAERVTATSLDSYCRDSGCIPYQEGAWMACEACDLCDIPRYYDYLRSNHMIREAE